MARIRTIKPEFFTSLSIAELALTARLTFIGLWTHCDDEGRCVDDARLIKAALWPLDDRTAADVESDLGALSEASLITRYEVNGRRYLAVCGWSEHQRVNRPTKSKHPAPDDPASKPVLSVLACTDDTSDGVHALISEDSLKAHVRKGTGNREQGKELPPTAGTAKPRPDVEATAGTIVAEWIERCSKRPPNQVIGQIGKHVKAMLAEGIDPDDIRRGVATWMTRQIAASHLPGVVNDVMNAQANGRDTPRHRPHSGAHVDPNAKYTDDPKEVFGS